MPLTLNEYREFVSHHAIRSAIINITDNCNLRCQYCFTCHNGRVIKPETLQQTAKFLLAQKSKVPVDYIPSISFFGGEPTLHFDDIIVPFVEWCKQNNYKFNFNITTNGLLLTESRLKYMKENEINPLLSIDGAKETQDSQRPMANGGSSFDVLKTRIPDILKYYPEITFRSAINPENVDYMMDNYLFAYNQGFHNYYITPNVYSKDWTRELVFQLCFNLWAITSVMKADIESGYSTLIFNDIPRFIKNILNGGKRPTVFNKCGLGTVSMGVACDGTINGCQEHNTYTEEDIFHIGNVFTGIDESRHLTLLNTYEGRGKMTCIDDEEFCKTCSFKDYCSFNTCPSRNIGMNNLGSNNSKITCCWQQTMHNIAKHWINTMDPNNPAFIQYLVR